jgi:uncharacterized protein YjbI with pentapeptide repeats
MVGASQAFAGDAAVKVQIDSLDERVSTIENQNLDARLGTLEAQNLSGRLSTVESELYNINLYLGPTITDLVARVQSLEGQVSGQDTQITSLNGRMNMLENYFDLLSAHLLGIAPGANLVAVDLTVGYDLVDAPLLGANMVETILTGVNMSGANLRGANLTAANLQNANLSQASLNYANLSGADMSQANLDNASLVGANMKGAIIYGASFYYADFTLADLRGVDLSGADLTYVTWANTVCPDGTNSNEEDGDDRTCRSNESTGIGGP